MLISHEFTRTRYQTLVACTEIYASKNANQRMRKIVRIIRIIYKVSSGNFGSVMTSLLQEKQWIG